MPEGKIPGRKLRIVSGEAKKKVPSGRVHELLKPAGKTLPIRVDEKGRLLLPKKLRADLQISPGDTLFLRQRGRFLHLAKPVDPFEVLAKDAVRQYRRGETVSLRKLAEAEGIDLNKKDDD